MGTTDVPTAGERQRRTRPMGIGCGRKAACVRFPSGKGNGFEWNSALPGRRGRRLAVLASEYRGRPRRCQTQGWSAVKTDRNETNSPTLFIKISFLPTLFRKTNPKDVCWRTAGLKSKIGTKKPENDCVFRRIHTDLLFIQTSGAWLPISKRHNCKKAQQLPTKIGSQLNKFCNAEESSNKYKTRIQQDHKRIHTT